jgi:hypothetical protein
MAALNDCNVQVWFPTSQRNTATSIANVANALGRAVGG